MIKNYVKIALRNLRSGSLYAFINIVGLTVGTTICILIMLFVWDEYSFDRFHSKSDEIYRVWVKEHYQGEVFFSSVTPFILGTELKNNIPECKEVMQYVTINSNARRGTFTDQESVHVVQSGFLSLFDWVVIEGSRHQALEELHNVAITSEKAIKYFGKASPLGQIVQLQVGGEWQDFRVSAVIEDPPSNSSHQFGFLIPFENVKAFTSENGRTSWTIVFPETYVWIDSETDMSALHSKIATMVDQKVTNIYKPGEYQVGLQPLTDIHLNPEIPQGIVPVSDRRYPRILSIIAILVLILACINFTSLAIGRSITRAKEVAMRKVSGAQRWQLMMQFWTEAILIAASAVALGVVLTIFLLPWFNTITSKELVLSLDLSHLFALLLLTMVTGLIAGFYPSAVLSRYSPLQALRGTGNDSTGVSRHRILRLLVGCQYLLSIILISSTLIMQKQLHYIQNKNLGYNREQVVVVPYQVSGQSLSQMWQDAKAVESRIKASALPGQGIIDLTTSTHTFGIPGWMRLGFDDPESDRFRNFTAQQIGSNYLDMMEIELLAGRNFHSEPQSDLKSAIINQAMADAFQISDPIGTSLPGPFAEYQIIGITEDFQYASLHTEVTPLVMVKDAIPLFRAAPDMVSTDGPNPKFSFRVETSDLSKTLTYLKQVWSDVAPEQPFDYTFLDQNIENQYLAESRLSKIVAIATLLAILIAGLGLFGIALLTVVQRKKEIGIRKVLGASVGQVVFLIGKKFSLMVLASAVVAIPISWRIMVGWLENYAYRIILTPWIFVLAAIIALILAWISISTQTLLAAKANPVDSLRE